MWREKGRKLQLFLLLSLSLSLSLSLLPSFLFLPLLHSLILSLYLSLHDISSSPFVYPSFLPLSSFNHLFLLPYHLSSFLPFNLSINFYSYIFSLFLLSLIPLPSLSSPIPIPLPSPFPFLSLPLLTSPFQIPPPTYSSFPPSPSPPYLSLSNFTSYLLLPPSLPFPSLPPSPFPPLPSFPPPPAHVLSRQQSTLKSISAGRHLMIGCDFL